MPTIQYPPELPISQRRDEIAAAIAAHQVVIVAGETGSGKTTQLPKICLELGREAIAHTQPRRIAARTIAERIAVELDTPLGELVGYQVRFTDTSSAETRIKLMTDGILLAALRHDRELRRYDTIIIDEAHERSLNIDFLLGYLKRLLPRRPDLKVIITSATIDPESFSRHFDNAPVIEVSGRTFPVEIRYRPLVAEAADDEDDPAARTLDDRDLDEGIVAALRELAAEDPGDVLVFLPGEAEIRDAADAIRASFSPRERETTEVLPLYGRLSAHEQHRVFEPSRMPGLRRRVVLATNVAETSLTVPGIAYVIDAGLARISRYSTRAKVQRLPIEAISQASANQRSGRSGRTRPGIAIRLYSEEDFARRPEFTDPEILRTNLASVLLQMLELDLGDPVQFPFLTPPDARGVRDGVDLLRELGALTPDGKRLTRTGREIAALPIEPRFARMVVQARRLNVTREVLAIVAGLTIQDVRERPAEHREKADGLHARFRDPTSDFMSLLALWTYLETQQRELSGSAFRRLCRAEFINFVRWREWQDLVRQLREVTRERSRRSDAAGRHEGEVLESSEIRGHNPHIGIYPPISEWNNGEALSLPGARADAIHRALLSGLLSHLGVFDRRTRDYRGARNTRFRIFPGSGLRGSTPEVVMAAELVETSALFARTVAKIDPAWAEEFAGDLAKRQHSEPHWERRAGQAVARETVTVYGVPIVQGRRVGLARIDAAWARDLFIRHALIEGDWTARYRFQERNTRVREEVSEYAERTRQHVLGDDTDALFAFFDARVPAEVVSQPTFDKWWRTDPSAHGRLLTLQRDDLLREGEDGEADEDAYPQTWVQGEQRLQLRYRFDPQAPDDGVSVLVPVQLLAMLSPTGFDWQVPGFRDELVTALLRSLPKVVRRSFVPAADWAARLLDEVGPVHPERGEPVPGPLIGELHAAMQRRGGLRFDEADFTPERLDSHLRMRFVVLDDAGRELGAGLDLAALQRELKHESERALAQAAQPGGQDAAVPGRRRGRGEADVAAVARRAHRADGADAGADAGVGAFAKVAVATEATTSRAPQPAAPQPAQEVTAWPGDLPESFELPRPHGVIRAWPSLRLREPEHPARSPIDLVLATTSADAARDHPRAVAALLARAVPSPAPYVLEHLTAAEKLALGASPYQSTQALLADAVTVLALEAVETQDAPVRRAAEFAALRDRFNAGLIDALFAQVQLAASTLTAHREALAALRGANALAHLATLTDVRGQLDALVYDGFISRTPAAQLRHLPRYLQAATMRVERLAVSSATERAGQLEFAQAWTAFTDAGGEIPLPFDAPARLREARWMLEEFRVSLYAQQLGTAVPVSLKRIRRALAGTDTA